MCNSYGNIQQQVTAIKNGSQSLFPILCSFFFSLLPHTFSSLKQKQAGKVAWQLPHGGWAFPMAGSSIGTNSVAQWPLCPRKSASRSPFQVRPSPDRHRVPDSPEPARPDVLTKRHAHTMATGAKWYAHIAHKIVVGRHIKNLPGECTDYKHG